ncbi:MAG: hypothetical protein J0L93_07210 [Deltaproteobacteria bacterium]|nr:hypothetical protein [Deltaproteobacteria bacterium]
MRSLFYASFILSLLFLTACSTHKKELVTSQAPKTILQTPISALNALILSEQFLEWQKGFGIRIRDHQQGLLVTEWTQDTPFERHRITLRSTEDPPGSVLSVHFAQEIFQNGKWTETPTTGFLESQLLSEIDTYLQKSPAMQSRKK